MGDRVTWGVNRAGVIKAIEGADLVILDDGWKATPPGIEPRCIATPPFDFRYPRDRLANLRKLS